MKDYHGKLLAHLADYKKRRLGVFEDGTHNRRPYQHILPPHLWPLNLLESHRDEIQNYLADNKINRHRFFHHLNSSQAFAFNLFYPFLTRGNTAARGLSAALGFDVEILNHGWGFEHVPDRKEGTNVDVMWCTPHRTFFCEVKLSEREFGKARDDKSHRCKREKHYASKMKSLCIEGFLDDQLFFDNYQLLRNICLLADNDHRLLILFPRENKRLEAPLNSALAKLGQKERERISKVYIEDCINQLQNNAKLPPDLRVYTRHLAEKYLPLSRERVPDRASGYLST